MTSTKLTTELQIIQRRKAEGRFPSFKARGPAKRPASSNPNFLEISPHRAPYKCSARPARPISSSIKERSPSSSIQLFPIPPDITADDLRDLFQSTIGPVQSSSIRQGVARVVFIRLDGGKAARRCEWSSV